MAKNKDGKYKEAIEDCSMAIVLSGSGTCPPVVDYYIRRAYAYWLDSQYDNAIADCKRVTDRKNTDGSTVDDFYNHFAQELLGNIYSNLRNYEKAIEHYEVAIKQNLLVSPGLLDKYREARNKMNSL
jgi:tetratricopeptide (TPR) repeat protein